MRYMEIALNYAIPWIYNANFTDDEKTVFLFLSKGKTIKEIAQKMSVCSRTVNRIIIRVNEKVHKLEVLN